MNSSRILEGTLLTTAEAAKYLNASKRFLENRRIVGGGPLYVSYSKKMVRYRIEDLQAWVTDKLRESTSTES